MNKRAPAIVIVLALLGFGHGIPGVGISKAESHRNARPIVFRHETTSTEEPSLVEEPQVGSDGELMIVFPKQRRTTPITRNQADDYLPARSPRGTEVVFASNRGGKAFNLYVRQSGGNSTTKRLTHTSSHDYFPDWSSEGRWVIFSRLRNHDYDVYKISARGGKATALTRNRPKAGCTLGCGSMHDIDPTWHPTKGLIAFASDRGGDYDLFTMDSHGNHQRLLLGFPLSDEETPEWSPDGQHLAFSSDLSGDYEIYVVDRQGKNLSRLTVSPGLDYAPTWSPNGDRLAFASNRDGDQEIYSMKADGSDLHQLTNNTGIDTTPNW
jgi:TolB protein